jgi:hypothetical protein
MSRGRLAFVMVVISKFSFGTKEVGSPLHTDITYMT